MRENRCFFIYLLYLQGGNDIRTGFIGAGKVGFSLGKYFIENGVEVAGYASLSIESAREAAFFTGTKAYDDLEALVEDSDIIFLTVPDGLIEEVWGYIKVLPIAGKLICHCSGSLSSSVFSGIDECGAYAYSVHPLFAISDKKNSYKELHRALFTLEGVKEHIREMEQLIKNMGNRTQIIDAASKTKYHAAAVMTSNQVVALAQIGIELLLKCGFSEANAEAALGPLMLGNMENIVNEGPRKALTGPVERNDIGTINKHIECLTGRERKIYVELSKVLLEIAKDKHPEKDYEEMEKEL